MRRLLLFMGAFALAITPAGAEEKSPPAERSAEPAFETVWRVLQSPRCRNCHPSGDTPLQYDEGRPHAMGVGRAADALGLACASCHVPEPLSGAGMPPGAPNWHLPPAETPMVFEGRLPRELCFQLKDPDANGGKDLSALLHHVGHDPLVLWGWSPGEGRTSPPVSHEAFVNAFRAWIDADAPCPEP